MSVGLADLLDPFQLYPVQQVLFSCLDVASVIRLSRTCKRIRASLPCPGRLWDVNRLIGRFMDDPQCFREEMRKHHAVVSGGLALQFFDREVWQESDMDVFVRRGVGSRALGQYLVQKEGYCMEKETSEEVFRRYLRSVGKVETYVKMDVGERRVVQIIAPERKHPVEAILTGFYGSAVMNIITWNRAYSLFPRTTFFRREMCVFRLVDSREEGQLAKYERRGWKECNLHPEGEIMDARRVGDSRTWVIRFGENEEEDNANAEVESWRFAVGERRIVLLKRLFLGIL